MGTMFAKIIIAVLLCARGALAFCPLCKGSPRPGYVIVSVSKGKPEYVKCPDFPKLMKFDIVQFFHNEKAYGEHGIITKTGVVDPTDWKKQASSEVLFFGPGEFGGSSARRSIVPTSVLGRRA